MEGESDRSRVQTTGEVDVEHLRQILAVPDRLDRVERLIAALRAIPADQVGRLDEVLRDRTVPFRELERVLVVAAWAEHDPAAATKWAIQSERGDTRDRTVADSVRTWARRDPQAVLETYDVATMSEGLPGLLIGFIEGWFGADDTTFLEDFVRDLGDGDSRQRAVDVLARLRVERDGGAATIEWAESIPSSHHGFRSVVFQRVAREIAKTEPRLAARWCERVCDSQHGDSMTQMIVRSWATHAGGDAMDWLLTRPDEQETWVAARVAYREFMLADPEEALAWMEATTEEQRQSRTLDGPVGMYLNARSWKHPEVAIEWTRYLRDDDERELALISIARRWLRRDEEAAEAWLAQSPLSEEAQEKARELPPRFGGGRKNL